MLYPLKFYPILKEKIWGGDKLRELLNKSSNRLDVGESWEVSTVGKDVSIISNGDYKGKTLVNLIKHYKEELLGTTIYQQFGDQFPLLIKFIDAKEDLSIQLHPNDELARARHNSFGKTEMWYVVQADTHASLIVGFNKDTSKEEYTEFLEKGKIEELLKTEKIKKGDSYFIEEGTIHAICKGTLIAEIQQTSDITYRVYDWGRVDCEGNMRELHTELALDALDYKYKDDYKKEYEDTYNTPNQIVSCKYFTTNKIKVKEKINRDFTWLDSFKIYLCLDNSGVIKIDQNETITISKGETVLIPAKFDTVEIDGVNLELLEIYIK